MKRLITDPLVHFLAIGVLLFGIFHWNNDTTQPNTIVIDADQIRDLIQARMPGADAPLTREQLAAIVEPAIRDEIYYREALALGLDIDDDQVRTRLIEKMRFLTENLADPEPEDDATLEAFFLRDPQQFEIPSAVTFEHVFLSPSQRGEKIVSDASDLLERLRAGGVSEGMGDDTPLDDRFENADRSRLIVLFGATMTAALFDLPVEQWHGPFESDFGLHVLRVISRRDARLPDFSEARPMVLEAYAKEQQTRRNEAALQEMRERYSLVIEWPESSDAMP